MRTIVLVHGMGETTPAEFTREFADAAQVSLRILGLTPTYDKQKKILSVKKDRKTYKSKLVAFGYNSFFKRKSEHLAEMSKSVHDRLDAIGLSNDLAQSVIGGINDIPQSFGRDKFFQTHFGDVLLYAYTTVGEAIRVSLAKNIAKLITEQRTKPQDIHIVAHSLGTSVTHDTLALLSAEHHNRDRTQLNITTHKLGSVHFFANVSRILEHYVPVLDSYVRPGDRGCTSFFYQYNHELDPFARVSPVNPPNNGRWIDTADYGQIYRAISTSAITGGNTHGLCHYLLNPRNSLQLFNVVLGLPVDSTFAKDAWKRYEPLTLTGHANKARDKIEDIDFVQGDSIDALTTSLKELSTFLKAIRTDFGKCYHEGF